MEGEKKVDSKGDSKDDSKGDSKKVDNIKKIEGRKGGSTDSLLTHSKMSQPQIKKALPTDAKSNDTKNTSSKGSSSSSSKSTAQQDKSDKSNGEKQKHITSFFAKRPDGVKNDVTVEKVDIRQQSHESSKALFAKVKDSLPATYDSVKVLNFGTINVSSSFHSSVQIYPVDYKCEIVISTSNYTCEISNRNDKPHFTICNNTTNAIYNGSSEAEVWTNLDLVEDKVKRPSFFNLKIELLIEGMENASKCKAYKFHKERGYETLYKTDAESYDAKLKYLAKELTKLTKFNNLLKPQPSKKDEEKRKKDEKDEEKRKKEAEKEEKIKQKELLKTETKEQKEKRLQDNKMKTNFRREITTSLKKVRQEVISLVTKEFDNEQDEFDQNFLGTDSKSKASDHDALSAYLNSLPLCHQFFNSADINWDDVLKIGNALQILRDHMDVPISANFCHLIESLIKISSSSSSEVAGVKVTKTKVAEAESSMQVDDGVNDDDEWDGGYQGKSDIDKGIVEMTDDSIEDAKAELDRIHLHVTKILSANLGAALDLTGDDNFVLSLPLNQLTWIEIARMSMLLHVVVESGENKDDYQYLIRGGKQLNFRSNKNICRAIRYRFTVRLKQEANNSDNSDKTTKSDDSSTSTILTIVDELGPTFIADKYKSNESLHNEFNDDEVLLSSRILSMSNDENELDAYRRCCKVFLKIIEMTASKQLLWEYGGGGEENDYYEIIKSPMAFCDVASNIIAKKYGSDNKDIVNGFTRDMLQVPINCITYNSELLPVVANAQKLIQAIHRHADRWLHNQNLPIESCDNQHCFLSGNILSAGPNNSFNNVKCGRCNGIFSLDALDKLISDISRNPTFCQPTHDVISITSEEWVCVFCLKEDSSIMQKSPQKNIFYIDEWGPSSFLPWLLNKKYTNLENIKDGTIESTIIEGLKIMVDSKRWTFSDHIQVLLALCETFKCSQVCTDKLSLVKSKFEDLIKFNGNTSQELEFTRMIKDACGENAFKYCRSIIANKDDSVGETDEFNLFLREGRCSICNKDTHYDNDQTLILLCDACNCDTHMECAGLTAAPKKGFYCKPCTLSESEGNVASKIEIENYRDFDLEHQLQERVLENKLASDNHDNDVDNVESVDESKVQQRCAYCKLTELEVCSPFVIGQARDEHNAYIDIQTNSTPEVPYFPLASGNDSGGPIIDEYKKAGREPIIVHEICAVNMFQARLNLGMYKKRKLWNKVTDKVINMSGIQTLPLGTDDDKRKYWKIANCDFIFISSNSPALNWRVVATTEEVQAIIDKLGSSTFEQALARNLTEFINDRNFYSSSSSLALAPHNGKEECGDDNKVEVMEENGGDDEDDDDNDPFELRLLESKGQTISKTYTIPEESVFMDYSNTIDGDEDPYLMYEKKAKYYAIALLNKKGKVVKLSRGIVTIRYLIHKDDGKILVGDVPLDEQWHSDNLYYFAVPVFKRSGNYIVSFIAEGSNVADIKPLVYRVQVVPTTLKSGMFDAIDKLKATQFLNNSQRQFRQTADVKQILNCITTELDTVKCALISVYCALPTGSIVMQPEHEVGVYDVYECITEATGWNDYLDQSWKGMVQKASTPLALMECAIVLEHFINKDWFQSPQNRLLNTLPNYHFALRCASLSAIALRVYCLDQALDYKKMKSVGRESRTSGRSMLEIVPTKPKKVSPPHQKSKKKDLDDFIDDDSFEEYTLGGRQRSKRAASTVATSKMKKSNYNDDDEEVDDFDNDDDEDEDDDDDDDEDEDNGRRSKRGSKSKRSIEYFDDDDDDDGNKRRSSRKKSKVNYNVDDNDDKNNYEVTDQIVYDDIDFEEEINNVKSDTELGDEERSVTLKCMEMLSILHDDKNTNIFWVPVDTNLVDDYLEHVSDPIDLGTITRNLRLGVYGTNYEAFANDVRKVWSNCTAYNFRGSGLYVLGNTMKVKWEKLFSDFMSKK